MAESLLSPTPMMPTGALRYEIPRAEHEMTWPAHDLAMLVSALHGRTGRNDDDFLAPYEALSYDVVRTTLPSIYPTM